MSTAELIFLSIVQGVTEFLPVSSSAHLILCHHWFGETPDDLVFDVAAHVGSLIAIILYFRHDLANLALKTYQRLLGGENSIEYQHVVALIVATLPVCCIGFLLKDWITSYLRGQHVIAYATLIFGVILLISDRIASQSKSLQQLSQKDALLYGCAQVLALIPGASRSGVTLTAGLLLGYDRTSAVRFSFLMSIPVICLAGGLTFVSILGQAPPILWQQVILTVIITAVAAYCCIAFFMRLLAEVGITPYIWYRLALGCGLLLLS